MHFFKDMYISYEIILHSLMGLDEKIKNVSNVVPLIIKFVYFSYCIQAVNTQRHKDISTPTAAEVSDFFLLNFTLQTGISVFRFTPSETDFGSGHSRTRISFFLFFLFFLRGSAVVPALQLRYVTVCLPGPPLNISLSHTWLRASPFSSPLHQGEGAIINRTLLHPQIPIRPLTLLPPSPSSSLPLNCRPTHTRAPSLFPPRNLWAFAVRLLLCRLFLRLTGQAGNGSERCMR